MAMILGVVEPDLVIVSTHVMLEKDVIIRKVRLLCGINLLCTLRMIYYHAVIFLNVYSYVKKGFQPEYVNCFTRVVPFFKTSII